MASGSPRNSIGNIRYMDTPYPEHLSLLNRHLTVEWSKPMLKNRRNVRPRNTRHRTQPVTFDEIQEVDEETSILDSSISAAEAIPSPKSTEIDLDIFYLSNSMGKMKPLGRQSSKEDDGKNLGKEGKCFAGEKKRKADKTREGSV
ncbi:hypothetical protein JTE90_028839 [Oedothorax gibbosus]|uniref:Uncharacterized protein n=1 Tax=Oedothorax gibbosus TaxID=931172 RepID=A0AAV6VX26_9ARAC|nr:hypothetical protein JTE90_028839 [Oedothorax gibbosus]